MAPNPLNTKDCSLFGMLGSQEEQAIRKLCEFFENTKDKCKDDDEPIAFLRTTKFDGIVQTRWWAGRYIGMAYVTLESGKSKEISIRPRFGEEFLLAIIEDVYNIKTSLHDAKDDSYNEWYSNLLNLLRRRIWVDKCAKANRYGLPRKNVKREYQGVTLRGALDIRRTIMPWLMKREVCTNVYEKTFDDNICRIVYEAHRILSRNVNENKLGKRKTKTQQIDKNVRIDGSGFSVPPTVQDAINTLNSQYKGTVFDLTEADYQRIRYKSIYVTWEPLVDFSWSVIRNRQLGYRSSEKQTECVFVDMAEIWEAFLRKKLGDGFPDWRVLSVEECTRKIYSGQFYKRDIIPDIILEKDGQYMVFDAKYKRMRGIKANTKDSDVDRTDLFQIHTYIQYVERNMGHVVVGGLLYPITKKGKDDEGKDFENTSIEIQSFHSDNLFGLVGLQNSQKTTFIIDGIYCSENQDYEMQKSDIENEVRAMIDRINQRLPEDLKRNSY